MGPTQLRGALTALIGFLARASNQIATAVVTLVATGFLSPTQFGIFALAAIAVTLIRTMLHTGAFEYLLKARSASDCSTECLLNNLVLAISLSLLLVVGSAGAHFLFGPSAVVDVLLALAPSNLIAAVGAWREALFLRTGRLKLYYVLTSITEAGALAVTIGLLYAGYGVYALVWQVYLRNALLLLLYLRTGPITWSDGCARHRFFEVLHWSLSRYGSVLLSFTVQYGADILLGIFLSPAATGFYRASSRLVSAVSDLFVHPIRMMAMTFFSARAAEGRESNGMWPTVVGLVTGIGWPSLVGLAILAPWVVPIILGEQWREAAPLVSIICLAHAAGLIDGVTGTVLVSYNHQRLAFRIQMAMSALLMVFVVCAAPFGLIPAAVAVVVGACANTGALILATLRKMPGSWHSLVAALATSAALGGATAAGALLAETAATRAGVGAPAVIAATVIGGIAVWAVVLGLLRARVQKMVDLLQDQPPPTSIVIIAEEP